MPSSPLLNQKLQTHVAELDPQPVGVGHPFEKPYRLPIHPLGPFKVGQLAEWHSISILPAPLWVKRPASPCTKWWRRGLRALDLSEGHTVQHQQTCEPWFDTFQFASALAFIGTQFQWKKSKVRIFYPKARSTLGMICRQNFILWQMANIRIFWLGRKLKFLLLFVIENMHSFSHGHLDFQHHSHPVPFLPVDTADTRIAWEGSTRSKKRPYKMITLQLDKISWASASTLGISSKNNRESRLEVYWCAFECPWKSNVLLRWRFNLRSRPQWISNQSTDFVNTKGSGMATS